MKVKLRNYEIYVAAHVGIQRQVDNLQNGREDAYGAEKNRGWQNHIEGALGEKAFAKAFGLYWSGHVGDLDADDVGPYQVRTRSEYWHELILHKRDKDDRPYVLLTGLNGEYDIRGWMFARDGKKDKYWKDPTGKGRWAYFIPQEDLNKDFDELMDLIGRL